ncbi:unnamed protein product [Nippostrongylus brasiliensis]|uniref:L-3,4-dihydroxyphenylalanine receptor (inferred by orthology to a C. elegans protein) n=1 Tax=Nippostrongylus brasiliensis TaxID=27835 RepID=A0A158QX80_NIPBR|nr:unnamed protein product [Nippostrongylus brasiliensis]
MVLPLALVGVILVSLFIFTTYKAIKGRVVSRKCYILLLNRAIGDLVSCIVALIVCAYVILWHEVNWVMFILMISYTVGISALVKVPTLNEWSGCKMETCLRTMYRIRNMFTVSVYLFTLIVFVITVLLIRRAQRFVDSFKKRDSTQSEGGRRVRFPLWKLALNVATFAVLYLFYVIWCVGMLLNTDQCFFQRNYAEMMRLLAFVRCTLLLRIVVDPVLSFVTDIQLRRTFLTMVGISPKKCASSQVFQKSTNSERSIGENGIERSSRSQTTSTTNSNYPSTIKF